MSKDQTKIEIKELVEKAKNLIPNSHPPNLASLDNIPNVLAWHEYEVKVWEYGEQIRLKLSKYKSLRKDKDLLDLFLTVCLDPNAKRGRQSFLMLFWYKSCQEYAPSIVTQINDEYVTGHIIEGLIKMHAIGYAAIIRRFTNHKITWIRNLARKYVTAFG